MGAIGIKSQYAPFEFSLDKFALQTRKVQTCFDDTQLALKAATTVVLGAYAEVRPLVNTAGLNQIITVGQDEVLRIVKGSYGNCNSGGFADLTCEAIEFQLWKVGGGFAARVWPGGYTGDILGSTGQSAAVKDDELVQPTDFQGWAAFPGQFYFQMSADVHNANAISDRLVVVQGSVMYEIWKATTVSRMRG